MCGAIYVTDDAMNPRRTIDVNRLDGQLLQDYLERRLAPEDERVLEEAMIANPALAEQVLLEMALRDGMRAIAARDGAGRDARNMAIDQPAPAAPATMATVQAPAIVQVRPPAWLPWFAAAAVLALVIGVGAPMLRAPAGQPGSAGGTLAAYRVEPDGTAAFLLPASFDATGPGSPLRLQIPTAARGIELQLDPSTGDVPRRLLLRSATHPGVSLVLDQRRLRESDGVGFVLTAAQLSAGPFAAEIERRSGAGWVREHSFTLRADDIN
jgi:hypothetical protein